MFTTLATASEYVSQTVSNMLSLKEWFSHYHRTQENSQPHSYKLIFGCLACLYLLQCYWKWIRKRDFLCAWKLKDANKSTKVYFQSEIATKL